MMLLILFWILYFVLHSTLAALKVKEWVRTRLPTSFKYYRLFYNAFALVSFILIMLYQGKLPPHPVVILPAWMLILGYALIVIGMIVISATFKNYDTSEFLGVKPMNEFNHLATPLIATGLNVYVRHPIYFGIIVTLGGYLFTAFDHKTLAFFSISVIYIIIGAMLEEQKVIVLYGKQYIEYKERVSMLFPLSKIISSSRSEIGKMVQGSLSLSVYLNLLTTMKMSMYFHFQDQGFFLLPIYRPSF